MPSKIIKNFLHEDGESYSGQIIFDCGCDFMVKDGKPIVCFDSHSPNFTINPECKQTWRDLEDYQQGVFQLELPSGQAGCKKLKPTNLEHIGALGAILRPGCAEARDENGVSIKDHYIKRKNNQEEVEPYHPIVDEVLKDTYNSLIYQESAMKLAVQVAGFNEQEADELRKCVTGDTMFISNKRGWVSIQDLLNNGYSNEKFLSILDNKYCWDEIVDVWDNGEKEIYEIESLSGYKIKTTKNHKLLTNNGMKKCKDLTEDDYLITNRSVEFEGEDIIDRDLAIVLCGILSEGHFFGKHCNFTSFEQDFMDIFISSFEKTFGQNRLRIDSNGRVAHIREPESLSIARYINKGLSAEKFLPDLLMSCTLSVCKDILSFLLGAEGSVNVSGQFEFSSKSEKFCQQIKILLLRFGIVGWLRKKHNKTYDCFYYRVYINDIAHQKIILSELSHLWPKEKRDRFEISINKRKEGMFSSDIIPQSVYKPYLKDINLSDSRLSNLNKYTKITRSLVLKSTQNENLLNIANVIYFDKVKSITKIGKMPVFDFTMKNYFNPQAIGNNIVISNSIGKKIPELMTKSKKLFLEKAKQKAVLSDEQIEEVFGWIEKSQRYSFNKCLAGTTIISCMRRTKTVGELYNIISYNVDQSEHAVKLRKRFKQEKYIGWGWSLVEDGKLIKNKIIDIKYAGVHPVFKVTLAFNESFTATGNHRIPTSNGEKLVSDLTTSDYLYTKRAHSLSTALVRVVSVEPAGTTYTYDVHMQEPYHNLCVNEGIVVCNSHAISYGLVGFICAYIKTHFPLQFYTAWLKNEKTEAYKGLVEEAKLYADINTYTPDLRDLQKDFYIKDGNIKFGLVNVKNVGEKDYEKLVNMEYINGSFKVKLFNGWDPHWPDLIFLVLDQINSRAAESLILSGALDYLKMDRQRLLIEFKECGKLFKTAKKERDYILENLLSCSSVCDILKMVRDEKASAGRKDKIQKVIDYLESPISPLTDTVDSILFAEQNLLGVALTTHAAENLPSAFETHSCLDINNGCADYAVLKVKIDSVKTWKDKNDNEMAFIEMSDVTSSLKATMFWEGWAKSKHLINEGSLLFVAGKKMKSFIIERVYGI